MAPVRTCVGCRTRAPRSSLIRIIAGPNGLLVDVTASLPGRGAWLHPNPRCAETALARKALERALRAGEIPADEVGDLARHLAADAAATNTKADRTMD